MDTDLMVVVDVEMEVEPWYSTISLEDAKAFIKTNMVTVIRSFIAIGFYLKYVRDKELFLEDGYRNISEFAEGECGLSKTYASRYMSINDKFSVGGNSPIVLEEYRLFDKSKLQEMLYLEDEQLKIVTPDMTVNEIREMRTPRDTSYFEIPGQMNLKSDFPHILPSDFFPDSGATLPMPTEPAAILPQTFTINVSDLLQEPPIIAMSQLEERDMIITPIGSEMAEIVPEDTGNVSGYMGIVPNEPEPISLQPELPVLKNNSQRAEFIDAYETWPIWIDTKETGERYYRYDLEDGESFVVKVYFHWMFDPDSTAVDWKDRYKDGWGTEEYYILKPGKHFKDCSTNRSSLIECLKDYQKKGTKES